MNTPPASSSHIPPDINGKRLWIFGGAGYLGRAVISALAAGGARIVCVDLPGRAAAFVDEASLDSRVAPVDADLGDVDKIEPLVESLCEVHGVPDGVANMTYGATASAFSDLTPKGFDRANRINLTAGVFLARAVGDRMAARGSGSIILLSSMYGTVSPDPACYPPGMNPNPIEYGTGKAGVQQMARYLAMQYGPSGVRCNCISPGPFTQAEVRQMFGDRLPALRSKTMLRRFGDAHEIAGSVGFLFSDASSYVTGHNLAVDGGWTAW